MTKADDFERAMRRIYEQEREECGDSASGFRQMLEKLGGLGTAHALLHAPNVSAGFTRLVLKKRADLTVEACVLKPEFRELFTTNEIKVAEERTRGLL